MEPVRRATFGAGELVMALSHYDLGVVESVTEFPRGSRQSPKVGIVCQRGKFLLKRRPLERADPEMVRMTHAIQRHLVARGFPAPKLVAPRTNRRDVVQIRGFVYELFEFVPGEPFRQTAAEACEAGTMLAKFHRIVDEIPPELVATLAAGDFHDAGAVRTGLCSIGSTLSMHDSFTGDEAELATLIQVLLEAYDRAAEAVNGEGFLTGLQRLIHSDWHPGNLLFRQDTVVAVLDYETLRLSRPVIDVANGALQFSMLAGGDPATWPDHLDKERFRAFLSGYESLMPLSAEQRKVLANLMIEALIAECVPPITQTGSVGRWTGFRVLQMVRRKVAWLAANGDTLLTASDR